VLAEAGTAVHHYRELSCTLDDFIDTVTGVESGRDPEGFAG
jgi:hypothetical protein